MRPKLSVFYARSREARGGKEGVRGREHWARRERVELTVRSSIMLVHTQISRGRYRTTSGIDAGSFFSGTATARLVDGLRWLADRATAPRDSAELAGPPTFVDGV